MAENKTSIILILTYCFIAICFYSLMTGVYMFSISQIETTINKIIYVIGTLCLLGFGVYCYFKYPYNN